MKSCIGSRHSTTPVKIPNTRRSSFRAVRTGQFETFEGDRLFLGRGRLALIDKPGIFEAEDLGDLGGSLLLVSGFRDGVIGPTVGTAVMVAPGVAITAAHVLSELLDKSWNVDARGPGSGGSMTWWRATGFSRVEYADRMTLEVQAKSDLAVMALELAGDPGRAIVMPLPLVCVDAPAVGEPVMVIGYQSDGGDPEQVGLQMSRGTVATQYLKGRDRRMLPNPCLEVELEIWGGMSGGAVVNQYGELIGIASTSIQNEERVAFVSLLSPLGDYNINVKWPRGWYGSDSLTLASVFEILEIRSPAPARPAVNPPFASVRRRQR